MVWCWKEQWLYLCTNHGKQPCSSELNSTSGGQFPLNTCFPLNELKTLIKIYKASGSENYSWKPPHRTPVPLQHPLWPREFAAAFETLNPALVREISSLCVLSLWFHLLLHEHHSAWHFCTAALNALPEQCGKRVEWQERHGAVRKKKIGSALISWQKSLDSLARA